MKPPWRREVRLPSHPQARRPSCSHCTGAGLVERQASVDGEPAPVWIAYRCWCAAGERYAKRFPLEPDEKF